MIRVDKRPETPVTLVSDTVVNLKLELSERIGNGEELRSRDFISHWGKPDVKKALWKMHRGKCCYCERKRDMKRESDVEHFRPKAGVTGDDDHPGYWWLAYEWDNYFLSCKKCNQEHKKNHFPLMDDSPRAYDEDGLQEEKPVLINPEKENPEDSIGFDWQGAYGIFVKAIGMDGDDRGHRTVNLLGLNEGTLPEQRAELVEMLQGVAWTMFHAIKQGATLSIDHTKASIKKLTSPEREFAGFCRAFFRGMGLGEYISTDG